VTIERRALGMKHFGHNCRPCMFVALRIRS
jgi:hypothetical protein